MRIDLGLQHFQLIFLFLGLLVVDPSGQFFDIVIHDPEAFRQKTDLIPGMDGNRKVEIALSGFVCVIRQPDHRAHDALGQPRRQKHPCGQNQDADDQKEQRQVQGFFVYPVIAHHVDHQVISVFRFGRKEQHVFGRRFLRDFSA